MTSTPINWRGARQISIQRTQSDFESNKLNRSALDWNRAERNSIRVHSLPFLRARFQFEPVKLEFCGLVLSSSPINWRAARSTAFSRARSHPRRAARHFEAPEASRRRPRSVFRLGASKSPRACSTSAPSGPNGFTGAGQRLSAAENRVRRTEDGLRHAELGVVEPVGHQTFSTMTLCAY